MKSKELSVELRDKIVRRHRSREGYKTISSVESSQEHNQLHHEEMERKWNDPDSSWSWLFNKTEKPGKKDLGKGGDQEPNDYSDRTT